MRIYRHHGGSGGSIRVRYGDILYVRRRRRINIHDVHSPKAGSIFRQQLKRGPRRPRQHEEAVRENRQHVLVPGAKVERLPRNSAIQLVERGIQTAEPREVIASDQLYGGRRILFIKIRVACVDCRQDLQGDSGADLKTRPARHGKRIERQVNVRHGRDY